MNEIKTTVAFPIIHDYKARVTSCWLGKAVGGTLGIPFEGETSLRDLTFYTPVPTEMLPNDDLDLQIVWACALDKLSEPKVDRHILSQAWLDHVEFPWDEYGVALRNLRHGLTAPQCGSYDNWFTHSMGAPIRSEIWACLAPGNPDLAAAYAYEDGCVDHGGEGLWAEVFIAALQSAAFCENDPGTLLNGALDMIPKACRTRRAVEDTRQWWRNSGDWRQIRDEILAKHGRDNFTDAPMNIAFTVLGWLAGGGDFSRTICIAVNCGMDTDCTGATVGALMGILDPDCIPSRWTDPIGRSLVLSPGIAGLDAPDTIDAFTDMVVSLREKLDGKLPNVSADIKLVDCLKVPVDIAYVGSLPEKGATPMLIDPEQLILSGTVGQLESASFKDEIALVRYEVLLKGDYNARVMFNTPQSCRVWVDGSFVFERGGGMMAPSFHRTPADQYVDLHLSAGRHELVAAIQRPSAREVAEWVVGIAHRDTMQWISERFGTVVQK